MSILSTKLPDGILLKPFVWLFVKLVGKPSLTKEQKEKAWAMFKEILEIVVEKGIEGLSKGTIEQLKKESGL